MMGVLFWCLFIFGLLNDIQVRADRPFPSNNNITFSSSPNITLVPSNLNSANPFVFSAQLNFSNNRCPRYPFGCTLSGLWSGNQPTVIPLAGNIFPALSPNCQSIQNMYIDLALIYYRKFINGYSSFTAALNAMDRGVSHDGSPIDSHFINLLFMNNTLYNDQQSDDSSANNNINNTNQIKFECAFSYSTPSLVYSSSSIYFKPNSYNQVDSKGNIYLSIQLKTNKGTTIIFSKEKFTFQSNLIQLNNHKINRILNDNHAFTYKEKNDDNNLNNNNIMDNSNNPCMNNNNNVKCTLNNLLSELYPWIGMIDMTLIPRGVIQNMDGSQTLTISFYGKPSSVYQSYYTLLTIIRYDLLTPVSLFPISSSLGLSLSNNNDNPNIMSSLDNYCEPQYNNKCGLITLEMIKASTGQLPNNNNMSDDSGLSSGAWAGIVVGVVVLIIILVSVNLFIRSRMKEENLHSAGIVGGMAQAIQDTHSDGQGMVQLTNSQDDAEGERVYIIHTNDNFSEVPLDESK